MSDTAAHHPTPRSGIMKCVAKIGSIEFAILSMLTLALSVAAGTLIDLSAGYERAHVGVYQAWWFDLLLLLICASLLASVAVRYPWHRNQLGFVLVHVSLAGMIISGLACSQLREEIVFSAQTDRLPFQLDTFDDITSEDTLPLRVEDWTISSVANDGMSDRMFRATRNPGLGWVYLFSTGLVAGMCVMFGKKPTCEC